MAKSNFGRKWPEITSKVVVARKFNGSIRRRPATYWVGAGGAGLVWMRASKPSGWPELKWPEKEIGVGVFTVSFFPTFSLKNLLQHFDLIYKAGIELKRGKR